MPKKQNLGLISVLKFLFNPGHRTTLYDGIRHALLNDMSKVRFAYARLLANILADLAIVIGAALIIAAIVMTSFPVPVLPALMVIGLMMIAAATVTRAITSLIHKFDINELRPYNWIGNTLVIASAGLMIASIFFPPLLLPLLVGAAAGLIVGSGTLIYGSYNYTKNSSTASKIPSSSASSNGSDESNASSTKNITNSLTHSSSSDSLYSEYSVDSTASTVSMIKNMLGNGKASGKDDENHSSRSSSSDTGLSVVGSDDSLHSEYSDGVDSPNRSRSSSLDSNESETNTWRSVRSKSTDSDNSIEPEGIIKKN